jgi:hypothetical protein
MKIVLVGVLKLAGMDINLGIFNFLLGWNGQGKYRAVLDTLHFYPGNGGSLAGVVKFPFNNKIGLAFLQKAASLDYISASNHECSLEIAM